MRLSRKGSKASVMQCIGDIVPGGGCIWGCRGTSHVIHTAVTSAAPELAFSSRQGPLPWAALLTTEGAARPFKEIKVGECNGRE
jgi:hypothetical protein